MSRANGTESISSSPAASWSNASQVSSKCPRLESLTSGIPQCVFLVLQARQSTTALCAAAGLRHRPGPLRMTGVAIHEVAGVRGRDARRMSAYAGGSSRTSGSPGACGAHPPSSCWMMQAAGGPFTGPDMICGRLDDSSPRPSLGVDLRAGGPAEMGTNDSGRKYHSGSTSPPVRSSPRGWRTRRRRHTSTNRTRASSIAAPLIAPPVIARTFARWPSVAPMLAVALDVGLPVVVLEVELPVVALEKVG
jgi:hypothetical protein